MPKRKEMRVAITGRPRPKIDVDAMTQIIIALGRELAARQRVKRPAEEETEMEPAP